jgi:hypothetical protein
MVSKKLSAHHLYVEGDFVEPLVKEAGFIDVAPRYENEGRNLGESIDLPLGLRSDG